MTDLITLRIPGRSTTKQRPRFNSQTSRAYTPPANSIGEADVRAIWREAGEPRIEDDVAIELVMEVLVPRPQTHFKSDGSFSATGKRHPIPRNKKPDLDNAVKLVMDSLNSRAYRDDVQIAKISIARKWSSWPETIVQLIPMHASDSITLAES